MPHRLPIIQIGIRLFELPNNLGSAMMFLPFIESIQVLLACVIYQDSLSFAMDRCSGAGQRWLMEYSVTSQHKGESAGQISREHVGGNPPKVLWGAYCYIFWPP